MPSREPSIWRGLLCFCVAICSLTDASPSAGQGSQHALRFFGTGGPGQQDRAIFLLDDNTPGSAGNTPLDIGQGSFTIEWWMRGELPDNDTANAGGDVELANTAGLVAYYRFEEGAGTVVADTSAAASPAGDLRSGQPGNGEWVSYAQDPDNTAPINPLDALIFADGFESGDLSAW